MKSAYPLDRIFGRDDRRVQPRDGVWQTIVPRDLSDCLLEAYDVVAARAAALMRESGMPAAGADPGHKLWIRAEREILGEIVVDMQVTAASVTALASLPEFAGSEITLGIEPRWMVLFARRDAHGEGGVPSDGAQGEGSSALRRRDGGGLAQNAPRLNDGARYAFCSIELPEEVDAAKCFAVFHDGLLGVRILRRG